MRALPVRRIALGALCAALLAGLTGPAAMAADTAPERDRATSPAALLAQVRAVDTDEPGLAPVVDLLKAVLETDDGSLPSGRAGKLGDAAKDALAQAADEDPVVMTEATTTETTTTEPSSSPSVTTTDDTQPTVSGDDLTSEEMAALREALDSLLDLLRPDTATDATADADGSTAQEPTLGSELAARVHDLVDALLDTGPQASTLPAPAAPAQTPLLPGVTLPALTSLLLPSAASS
ncbi:hypothetical protein ACH4VX_20360 [Streptomyces sp. NPDC020731]|uniref:hypothetical protein n=1 Tax=Streptomyces sp. NPDC020731 TaxID=3365085 RepID=UPI0037A1DF0D